MKIGNLNVTNIYVGELPVTSLFLGNLPIVGGGETEGKFKLIGLDDNLDEATGDEITCWGITEYTGSDTEIVMPSYHKGLPIRKIVDFEYSCLFNADIDGTPLYNLITSITLPEELEYLGDGAIAYCNQVTNIDLPESLLNIGAYNFSSWSSLEEISLPSNITYIASNLFAHSGLTYIDIPDGVTSIADEAFNGCSNLVNVGLPASLEGIHQYAFSNNTSGGKVFYRGTIEEWIDMWKDFFDRWSTTTNDTANPLRCGRDLYLLDPSGNTLFNNNWYSIVTTLDVPEGVTKIDEYTFEGCSSITTVNFPSTLTSIDGFSYMPNLTRVVLPATVTTLDYGAFEYCTNVQVIDIKEGNLTQIPMSCFERCTALQKAVIPLSLFTNTPSGYVIERGSFAYCSNMKIYFGGTSTDWNNYKSRILSKGYAWDKYITTNTRYYYSEERPASSVSSYWHYVNGEPTIWS